MERRRAMERIQDEDRPDDALASDATRDYAWRS